MSNPEQQAPVQQDENQLIAERRAGSSTLMSSLKLRSMNSCACLTRWSPCCFRFGLNNAFVRSTKWMIVNGAGRCKVVIIAIGDV